MTVDEAIAIVKLYEMRGMLAQIKAKLEPRAQGDNLEVRFSFLPVCRTQTDPYSAPVEISNTMSLFGDKLESAAEPQAFLQQFIRKLIRVTLYHEIDEGLWLKPSADEPARQLIDPHKEDVIY